MDALQNLMQGEFSPEVINNLKQADPEAMRQALRQHLPDEEVERILARVKALCEGNAK